MSKQNAMASLQAGMINYLGAAQNAIPEEGLKKNRAMVAMLMDLILMTAQPDKTKPCHIGILEPVLQGIIHVINQHQNSIAQDPNKENALKSELILDLERIVMAIEDLKIKYQDQLLEEK